MRAGAGSCARRRAPMPPCWDRRRSQLMADLMRSARSEFVRYSAAAKIIDLVGIGDEVEEAKVDQAAELNKFLAQQEQTRALRAKMQAAAGIASGTDLLALEVLPGGMLPEPIMRLTEAMAAEHRHEQDGGRGRVPGDHRPRRAGPPGRRRRSVRRGMTADGRRRAARGLARRPPGRPRAAVARSGEPHPGRAPRPGRGGPRRFLRRKRPPDARGRAGSRRIRHTRGTATPITRACDTMAGAGGCAGDRAGDRRRSALARQRSGQPAVSSFLTGAFRTPPAAGRGSSQARSGGDARPNAPGQVRRERSPERSPRGAVRGRSTRGPAVDRPRGTRSSRRRRARAAAIRRPATAAPRRPPRPRPRRR